ncbi:unnamed protein product [Prunus armeniaca]|uniref:Pentacotripeptide-repeat region of PRORP domain-containing protein n=1 Tax=Prunus armeniaca TaxID=36596 RepID=A0A6J5VWV4_PRUAR|nr:unnamed protein product [Prunus armeniaca]
MATGFILGLSTPLNTTSDPELLGQLLCPRPKKEVGNDNCGRRKRVGFEPLQNGVVCLPNGFAISGAACMGTFWGFSGMEGWSGHEGRAGVLGSCNRLILGFAHQRKASAKCPSHELRCPRYIELRLIKIRMKMRMLTTSARPEKGYPDVVTYNTLNYGLCQSGKWEKAKSFLIYMVDSGFPPDVYTYAVLISALCREERIQEALALFEDMTGKGINPNVFIFNSLVSASCKCCKWEKSAQLFQNMIDCGSMPDIVTFTAVLAALCKEGKTVEALNLVEEMTRRGQMPNLVTYNSLINGLCQSGQWREDKVVE